VGVARRDRGVLDTQRVRSTEAVYAAATRRRPEDLQMPRPASRDERGVDQPSADAGEPADDAGVLMARDSVVGRDVVVAPGARLEPGSMA
jgi:hypothetical protein